ncbi:MAG TPA: biotin attachment protein [Cryomorphaceae bacterium]|nr:biotin attachment protein [Owenweeksia sp.]MBF97486.1 biotin attachment protein [Owenweeksia sp.]HAD95921.1 biotin attachment protein [Cryomorphaceae bacterium]HBF19752.1 biotin attachment protein [Cryomorphaceae bacterium]HCQ14758.1 biotin attachment protein [Cryomorphaceae bacterium]|tara:strand:+ start:13373 stop:14725 length:1353 start_codon:yes stop_codon:yes gene_type:complete
MLNISENSTRKRINSSRYKSLLQVENRSSGQVIIRLSIAFLIILVVVMFLPWTQNITARGNITTLKPAQRPQTIHSVIAGRIEEWHVQEGDFVEKGDTILFISEIKDQYFDPELLGRTEQQLRSKEMAVKSYSEKVSALDVQIDALLKTSRLKLEQSRNKLRQAILKVTSDSIDFQAAQTNFEIARQQYQRFEDLYEEGLKSLTDLENRRLTLQKAQAAMISAENKLLASRNEVINAQMEIASIQAQYKDNIAKAEAEKYASLSQMYDSEVMVTKLQNEYMNYSVRSGLYYIKAPQDGYVTKTIQSGIGETIKEGTAVVSIMPARFDLAVEMYVNPMDLPLLDKGQHVRIQFDGWPAIVFSGWPNTSYGTYGGQVYAIDNFISDNGKYRVLVAPDPNDHPWPDELRVGSGTRNMLLLSNVLIGYELWRKINGFPPDYYKPVASKSSEKGS